MVLVRQNGHAGVRRPNLRDQSLVLLQVPRFTSRGEEETKWDTRGANSTVMCVGWLVLRNKSVKDTFSLTSMTRLYLCVRGSGVSQVHLAQDDKDTNR